MYLVLKVLILQTGKPSLIRAKKLLGSFNTEISFYPESQLEVILLSNGGERTDRHMYNIQKLVREYNKI